MMLRGILAAAVALCLSIAPALASDCSGTITTGGTAQTIAAINGNVKFLLLINNSANLMCFSFNGSPAAIAGTNCASGSWPLQPGSATTAGGSFYSGSIKISVLSIISSTTTDRFSCERQ